MNTSTDVVVNGNKLGFSTGETLTFDLPISESLTIGDVTVIRLRVPADVIYNENVFGISLPEKKVLWQVPLRQHVYEFSPYLSISARGKHIALANWDGTLLTLDPSSGDVIDEEWHK